MSNSIPPPPDFVRPEDRVAGPSEKTPASIPRIESRQPKTSPQHGVLYRTIVAMLIPVRTISKAIIAFGVFGLLAACFVGLFLYPKAKFEGPGGVLISKDAIIVINPDKPDQQAEIEKDYNREGAFKRLEPWPLPAPSANVLIPRAVFASTVRTLGETGEELVRALRAAGYSQHAFHFIPGGFAAVTRLEQIRNDGTPREDSRWAAPDKAWRSGRLSLGDYFDLLFRAPEGRYRVIVFALTSTSFPLVLTPVTRDTANTWMLSGRMWLPSAYYQIPFDGTYHLSALIYEFYAYGREAVKRPAFVAQSAIPGDLHLANTNLWTAHMRPVATAGPPK